MIEAEIPVDEGARQAALNRYGILDSAPEEIFNNITALMAHISGAPISLIAMLDHDRNWFKSHHGVDLQESPRSISFCGHLINEDEPILIVQDARKDARFHDNPLVTEYGAVFYAGVPLVTPDGFKIGTLCLFDREPRVLNQATTQALINMAKQVEALLELNYKNRLLTHARGQLEQRNEDLARFAGTVSHDLKSPISSIVYIAELLERESSDGIGATSTQRLQKLKATTRTMAKYVDQLLALHTTESLASEPVHAVDLQDLIDELKTLAFGTAEVAFTYPTDPATLRVNRSVLLQILLNLVTNAIKYCDKPIIRVTLSILDQPDRYEFSVQDNGRGFPAGRLETLFQPFASDYAVDRHGNVGTGIGLSNVKKLVHRVGGEISAQTTPGVGSTFRFTVPKVQP